MQDSNRKIIKQDSPKNIMWQLFRIEVEKQTLPKEALCKTERFVHCLGQNKATQNN